MRVLVAAAAIFLSAGVMKADSLVGGTTTVSLNSATVSELGGLFSIGVVSPATLNGLNASFPIVGNTATTISHSGGLSLTGTSTPKGVGTTVAIENFLIDLTTDKITGTVVVNGMTTGTNVPFFDFNSGLALTLDPSIASALTGLYGIPDVSGLAVGTAAITAPAATPEPASLALLGLALGGLGFVTYRQRALA